MVEKADLTTVVIPQPFASEGDKNVIPVADGGTNAASWNLGFPPKTSLPYDEDGLPPDRYDFNGVINATTNAQYNIQLGIQPTFDQNVSNAIGGYPKGSILMYDDGEGNVIYVQSLKDNNTANFNTTPSYIDDGTNWETVIPTKAWVESTLQTGLGDTIMRAPDWSTKARLVSGTTVNSNGWVMFTHRENYNVEIIVNGIQAYRHWMGGGDSGDQYQCGYIPIGKGDTITYSGMDQNNTEVYFIKCKGA